MCSTTFRRLRGRSSKRGFASSVDFIALVATLERDGPVFTRSTAAKYSPRVQFCSRPVCNKVIPASYPFRNEVRCMRIAFNKSGRPNVRPSAHTAAATSTRSGYGPPTTWGRACEVFELFRTGDWFSMIEEVPSHSLTRYSARSSSNSSFAPFGRFNSWPRPDSIR